MRGFAYRKLLPIITLWYISMLSAAALDWTWLGDQVEPVMWHGPGPALVWLSAWVRLE